MHIERDDISIASDDSSDFELYGANESDDDDLHACVCVCVCVRACVYLCMYVSYSYNIYSSACFVRTEWVD